MTIGRQTNTIISICYIKGIVNQNVLKEVRRRLSNIDTDSILESGYLEQFIEDAPMSLLATVGNSEKPDIIAGKLLEGRVAILCDGTPNVLTVPFLFVENLQSSEDYYSRLYISSMLRILRVIALWISLFLAPIYVAIETYHQEMIPTVLLTTMMGASSHIPLPAFVEATLMLLMFQLLRESGTRLPRAVGPAISIVGALVLGDAAVNAGIISAPMIIVIALTAICSFVIPPMVEFMALYRFILVILAGFMGLFGITAGVYILFHHTTALTSFGVPYCSPFSFLDKEGLKDSIVHFPIWSQKNVLTLLRRIILRGKVTQGRTKNMLNKKMIYPIIIIFCCYMFTGCWDHRELKELAVVEIGRAHV